MQIIVPKRYYSLMRTDMPIFLAGPVQGGGDWQRCFIEHFLNVSIKKKWSNSFIEKYLPRIKFIVPCRWNDSHPLSEYFVADYREIVTEISYSDEEYLTHLSQTAWEVHYLQSILDNGGVILFGLFPESKENPRTDGSPYARDTFGEIARYTSLHQDQAKIVIGAHEDFVGIKTIRRNLFLFKGEIWLNENFRYMHKPELLADYLADNLL